MTKRTMDLRGLTPPEPMERILAALGGDGEIEATLPHQPVPLYGLLADLGYEHEIVREEPGLCVVRIRKRQ